MFKQIIPSHPGQAHDPRAQQETGAHDGHEWLYVITGQLRLTLGDKDFNLAAGELPSSTRAFRTRYQTPAPSRQSC